MAAPAPVAAPAPAPVQAAAAAPAAASGEVKPSTRGWTMLMDEPEADPATLAVTTPAAASAPAPASPDSARLDDARGAQRLAAGRAPRRPLRPRPHHAREGGAGPAAAAAAAGGAPSSRGWTMFMEAELQGKEEPKAEPAAADPEFYDGQVTTDSGTVVAFAPTAGGPAGPSARRQAPADLSPGTEEMTSFGSRFRSAEAEAPAPAEAAPQTPPDLPSFAGNSSFDFGGPHASVQAAVRAGQADGSRPRSPRPRPSRCSPPPRRPKAQAAARRC